MRSVSEINDSAALELLYMPSSGLLSVVRGVAGE